MKKNIFIIIFFVLASKVNANETIYTLSFNKDSGFYSEPFILKIESSYKNLKIIYTVDGSDPNPSAINGKSFSYKNHYSYTVNDSFGEFKSRSNYSYKYSRPIIVRDRTGDKDQYTTIATSLHANDPHYFPDIKRLRKTHQRINKFTEPANRIIERLNIYFYQITGLNKVFPLFNIYKAENSNKLLKATVVRAAGFIDEKQVTPEIAATFFVMDRDVFELPVVSIIADDEYLFSYEKGILVAGITHDTFRKENPDQQRGQASAPANWKNKTLYARARVHYFSSESNTNRLSVDKEVELKVHGGASRFAPNKTLRIKTVNSTGNGGYFNYDFFKNGYRKHKTLLLRNSGSDFHKTLIRDSVAQVASSGLGFDTQAYQPAVLFINGEYWGIKNIRERYDRHYLAGNYGVKRRDLEMIKLNEAVIGSDKRYQKLMAFVDSNSLKTEENFRYIETQIDIDNLISYLLAQMFFANRDWPHNNIRFWRSKNIDSNNAQLDGRWRWLMYDLDFALTAVGHDGFKNVFFYNDDPNHPRNQFKTLFVALFENEEFKSRLRRRALELLEDNFSSSVVSSIIVKHKTMIESEMPRHIGRWKTPESIEDWNNNIEFFHKFSAERPAIFLNQLNSYTN